MNSSSALIRDEQRQIDDVLLHVVIDADMRTVDADPPPGEVEFLRRCPIGIWDAEQPMRYIGTPDEWLEEAVSLYSVHPLEGMLETQATAFHTSFSRDEGSDAQQVFFVLDYCDGDSAPFSGIVTASSALTWPSLRQLSADASQTGSDILRSGRPRRGRCFSPVKILPVQCQCSQGRWALQPYRSGN